MRTTRIITAISLAMAAGVLAAGCTSSPAPISAHASTSASATPAATPSATTAAPSATPSGPAAFGRSHGWTYQDGMQVSVLRALSGTLSAEGAGGNAGDPTVTVWIKITAGKVNYDASQLSVSVSAGPDMQQLSQVFDTQDNPPSGILTPGESGTYGFDFDLQQASWGSQLQVTVTPDYNSSPSAYAGGIK